MHNITFWKQL